MNEGDTVQIVKDLDVKGTPPIFKCENCWA
ncbi:MAG: PhnA domain-containing protein [Mariniblastus sp.]